MLRRLLASVFSPVTNCLGRLFRSRKNGKQESDGDKFIQYSAFVSELRHHMLSYLNSETLINYSQCSKRCNSEVRKFNTIAPKLLTIIEGDNGGILVKLSYPKAYAKERELWTYPDCIEKRFLFSTFEEALENAEQYVLGMFRYVKEGETAQLSINLPKWPTKIMNIKNISNIETMSVDIENSMLDGFVEFTRNSKAVVKNLFLYQRNEQDEIDNKIKQAFTTAFFRQLSEVHMYLHLDLNDEDFLAHNDNLYRWII